LIWWASNKLTVAGGTLSAIAVVVSAWAVVAGADKPVNVLQTVLFIFLAAILQAGAAFTFNRSGRADPSLARSAVRRLLLMVGRAQKARKLAEKHYEAGTPSDAKKAMGMLSVELSFLEEGFTTGAQDWAEFHPEAFRKIQEENQ
jgi:hypothetical protein